MNQIFSNRVSSAWACRKYARSILFAIRRCVMKFPIPICMNMCIPATFTGNLKAGFHNVTIFTRFWTLLKADGASVGSSNSYNHSIDYSGHYFTDLIRSVLSFLVSAIQITCQCLYEVFASTKIVIPRYFILNGSSSSFG